MYTQKKYSGKSILKILNIIKILTNWLFNVIKKHNNTLFIMLFCNQTNTVNFLKTNQRFVYSH